MLTWGIPAGVVAGLAALQVVTMRMLHLISDLFQ